MFAVAAGDVSELALFGVDVAEAVPAVAGTAVSCGAGLGIEVWIVVDGAVELSVVVGTTTVESARSENSDAKESGSGLSDSPLGASGDMYSGDGVVLSELAAMTPAVPVAPSKPTASIHGPGRSFIL